MLPTYYNHYENDGTFRHPNGQTPTPPGAASNFVTFVSLYPFDLEHETVCKVGSVVLFNSKKYITNPTHKAEVENEVVRIINSLYSAINKTNHLLNINKRIAPHMMPHRNNQSRK